MNLDQTQRNTVYGFVRKNYNGVYPIDIIDIICRFYLIQFDTDILNSNEQLQLMNLLLNTLKKQKGKQTINTLTTKLLYRASEHQFSSQKFHLKCDKQGPTFCIIHNEYDYIFGGYANISFNLKSKYSMDDPNSFLYSVRPTVQLFELCETEKDGVDTIWNDSEFGPVLGRGNDLCISHDSQNSDGLCQINPASYKFTIKEMCGTKEMQCSVKDYEVFSIDSPQ
eukprot:431977_1